MAKKSSIRNNFYNWTLRSVPYFVFLLFIFIIFTVFMLQPNSFMLQSRHGWDHTQHTKASLSFSFSDIYKARQQSQINDQIQAFKATHQQYPSALENLELYPKEHTWKYRQTGDTYQLYYDKETP